MNKKTRKIKKDIKRNLRGIGFKKSCKELKNNFLTTFKTAIYDSSYSNEDENTSNFHSVWRTLQQPLIESIEDSNFHPVWRTLQQPLIESIEDGNIVENSGCFLPLNISKATNAILYWKKFNKVLISCYNFQYMELNWIII